MSKILVEARVCPVGGPALDTIASTCRDLGHEVSRWRGPFSGRVPYWKYIFPCDLAVLFNGAHPRYESALAKLQRMRARLLFVEIGWNPQQGTCQIDPHGINSRASWSHAPLEVGGIAPLPVRQNGDLLVILQLDNDTQITQLSPWFRTMVEFVSFICRHSRLPVRIRKHPKAPDDPALNALVASLGASWDQSPSLAAAFESCRAVACINSSSGVEALGHGLPVLCYGDAVYRHPGAVYCLTNFPQATIDVTSELATGRSTLTAECADAAFRRVMDHQWTYAEIPVRLPPLLEAALSEPVQYPPIETTSISPVLSLYRGLMGSTWTTSRKAA